MSLRARLTLLVAAVAVIATAFGAVGARISTGTEMRVTVDRFLRERADDLVSEAPGLTGEVPAVNEDEVMGENPLTEFDAVAQLIDATGQVTLATGPVRLPVGEEDAMLASTGGDAIYRTVAIDGDRYRIITAPIPGGGAVEIGRSLEETDTVLAALTSRLIVTVAVAAALAALLAWALVRRVTAPIERLRDSVERVAVTQDLSTPITAEGSTEVATLARSYNTMLRALDQSRQQQRHLVMDANHELRTPLTSLRTNVDLLRAAPTLGGDERERLLEDVGFELDQLVDIVTELVELATDTAGDVEPEVTLTLDEPAHTVAERAQRRWGRVVEVRAQAPAPVAVGPSSVERAIGNLVDNAVKYGPEDQPVIIEVEGTRLEVADRGPGIAPADLPRVFDRFYRSAEARRLPGSGLGLAIVEKIVGDYGGRVWVRSEPGEGTVIGFELPADGSPKP